MKAIVRYMILLLLSMPLAVLAQSAGRNYVKKTTYRQPFTVPPANPTVQQAMEDISYFDGLGRPLQQVSVRAVPAADRDLVVPVTYDSLGRQDLTFLPYATAIGVGGAYKTGAVAAQASYYGTPPTGVVQIPAVSGLTPSFSRTVFESSPLDRVLQQGAPGAGWQPYSAAVPGSGHTVKTVQSTNVASEVRAWRTDLSGNGASSTAYYAPGRLYKTIIKDENWTSGKSGTVEEFKDTDDRIVLRRIWETESKSLSTYYVYNDYGDLCYVIPPAVTVTTFTDADTVFDRYIFGYKYDVRRRMTDRKIPGKGWEYLIYNVLDRLVLTQDAVQRAQNQWSYTRYDAHGQVVSSGLYTNTVTTAVAAIRTLVESYAGALWENRTGATSYPYNTFPAAGTGITITELLANYYDDYAFTGASTLPASGITPSGLSYAMQTGSKVCRTDGSSPLVTVLYYDHKGRVVQTAAQNHLGGTDYVTNTYSFIGELLSSSRAHKASPSGAVTTIVTKNEYDHRGRLTTIKHKIGSQDTVTVAAYTYNELGQLIGRSLGKKATEPDYVSNATLRYNERGWLKTSTAGNFSQQLNYQDGTNPQWNGNISQQLWGTTSTPSSTFSYQYDRLDRLSSGTATGMSESMLYDDMGNITKLTRDGSAINYSYLGNRISSLSGGLTGSYTYDANGNTLTDRTGMTLTYNQLNLPATANKSGVSLSYLYDALGNKLRKTATVSSVTTVREYVGGIEYNGANIDIIHFPEGYALKSGATYVYHHNLTDHLGNIRATLKRGATPTTVDVVQRDDYYPFGKRKVVTGGINKYLYNGKEIQGELGDQYDYGARFYDSEIGRWNVTDPMSEKYFDHSPYNYTANNPIRFIDPDGMAWEDSGFGMVTRDLKDITNLLGSLSHQQEQDPNKKKKQDPPQKKNGGGYSWGQFGKDLLDGTPVAGKAWTSGQRLEQGDYLGAAGDFSTALAEGFTMGFSSKMASASANLFTKWFGNNATKGGTTTVFRNFSMAEYKALRASGNKFEIGTNFGSKQFWLDKEGITWWNGTSFSSNFTAKITVNNNALQHGYKFLDAGKYRAISFDSQGALNIFNKNMKIEWIQYK
ncbi:DUF6443 domain-containing protein [Sphingobacterium faecium]|uniref:DUF6443 domain-containing protein n=1 Tax=Sphingobacterium faecium TaxID=34087 RepID=UPI0032080499